MDSFAVRLKIAVYQVNLLLGERRATLRHDSEYYAALGATPLVRLYGMGCGPAAANQDWHGEEMLGRSCGEHKPILRYP
jgi:hypothetical protein